MTQEEAYGLEFRPHSGWIVPGLRRCGGSGGVGGDVKQTDAEKLEIAIGALADIAFSDDVTLEIARKKAKRIYEELRADELAEERASHDCVSESGK